MNKLILSLLALFTLSISKADNILVIGGTHNPTTTFVTDNIEAALVADGHTVTVLRFTTPTSGQIATELANNTYDQIFIWDRCRFCQYLAPVDVAAIGDFWRSKRALVVDTRSYGLYSGNPRMNASEEAFLQNVAAAFSTAGGGVWIGTDHDQFNSTSSPGEWTQSGNALLANIGVNPITGSFNDPVNFADPSSVLLQNVTPNDLSFRSVGRAPIGPQPNGIEMFIHFGHDNGQGNIIPYISASFPLSGPTPASPSAIPVNSLWMLLSTLILLIFTATRYLRPKSLRG